MLEAAPMLTLPAIFDPPVGERGVSYKLSSILRLLEDLREGLASDFLIPEAL